MAGENLVMAIPIAKIAITAKIAVIENLWLLAVVSAGICEN